MSDEQSEEPAGPDTAARRAARAKRRAEVFGDVLPESTRDDLDQGADRGAGDNDEWLRRNVPPHHG